MKGVKKASRADLIKKGVSRCVKNIIHFKNNSFKNSFKIVLVF